jgi:hypothetical protein
MLGPLPHDAVLMSTVISVPSAVDTTRADGAAGPVGSPGNTAPTQETIVHRVGQQRRDVLRLPAAVRSPEDEVVRPALIWLADVLHENDLFLAHSRGDDKPALTAVEAGIELVGRTGRVIGCPARDAAVNGLL